MKRPMKPRDRIGARELDELTSRQHEVYELLLGGLQNKEIAQRLSLRVRTIRFHVANVLRKLHVDSRIALIVAARDGA